MGKPISDAMGYDAPATARCIQWNAEAIDKVYDEVAPVTEDALALVTREALGVVAAVVPWNFPTVMAAWKIGPALATGNSVIVKPSEKSPLTAILLADLAKQAGIPAGVFQVLPGFGHEAGQALAFITMSIVSPLLAPPLSAKNCSPLLENPISNVPLWNVAVKVPISCITTSKT